MSRRRAGRAWVRAQARGTGWTWARGGDGRTAPRAPPGAGRGRRIVGCRAGRAPRRPGHRPPGPRAATGRATEQGKVVFVYPGQGSQWLGMGASSSPPTPPSVRRSRSATRSSAGSPAGACATSSLARPGGRRPRRRLRGAARALHDGRRADGQLAGERHRAAAVVGHSQGEVVAAVVSGALSLEEGALLAVERSRAVRSVSGNGAMALVEQPVEAVEEILAPATASASPSRRSTRPPRRWSPATTTRSTSWSPAGRGRHVLPQGQRRLRLAQRPDGPAAAGLRERFAGLAPTATTVAFHSTVLGREAEGRELDGDYSARNLRERVQFGRVVEQ